MQAGFRFLSHEKIQRRPRTSLTTAGEIVMLSARIKCWEAVMAWNTPEIEEVTCGMEINMYFPAETEEDLF